MNVRLNHADFSNLRTQIFFPTYFPLQILKYFPLHSSFLPTLNRERSQRKSAVVGFQTSHTLMGYGQRSHQVKGIIPYWFGNQISQSRKGSYPTCYGKYPIDFLQCTLQSQQLVQTIQAAQNTQLYYKLRHMQKLCGIVMELKCV